MQINVYPVKNKLLQPFIKHFYSLQCEDGEAETGYIAFPGIHHFVTMNENANREHTGNRLRFSHQPGAKSVCDLVCNFGEPHVWQYKGKIREWNTCFELLGFNAFVDRPLSRYQQGSFTPFAAVLQQDMQLKDLEAFWLAQFRGFSHPWLYEAVAELTKENEERLTLAELAAQYGIARSTLHETFVAYVGTTPQRLEKIARFRRTLEHYKSSTGQVNLSNVAQLCSYFDQSHMIRDFRNFTGYSPKDFFSQLTALAGGINWRLV